MRQSFAVSSLFRERILLPPESISNSMLGYFFFREKILEIVLGDSETNILYWVGKEIGNALEISVAEELEDIFLQLDFGQVHLEHQSPSSVSYRLTHNRLNLLPKKRLESSLHLEAGLMAGAMEKLTGHYCAATLTIQEHKGSSSATIEISIDEKSAIT
ncbi:DUF2507 domain-containing protein [Ammoniphilus sp. CFH 90114]|uniref:DUF2507 domain-containing protein n=1 Tax=Ammoniphilus sp. CFH 90114 TaxID=2493665 RepID=UPI0013E8FF97|nr:DUF2507 domain-containing protein [Ammoniphilus sp. CFH 90114]